jgi:hypothetical protein
LCYTQATVTNDEKGWLKQKRVRANALNIFFVITVFVKYITNSRIFDQIVLFSRGGGLRGNPIEDNNGPVDMRWNIVWTDCDLTLHPMVRARHGSGYIVVGARKSNTQHVIPRYNSDLILIDTGPVGDCDDQVHMKWNFSRTDCDLA